MDVDNLVSSDDESADEEEIRKSFEARAREIEKETVPPRSKNKYVNCYETLVGWQKQQKTTSFDENVLLVYFKELSEKYSPGTLWPKWSMLKSILRIRHEININNYVTLKAFLRQKTRNYKPKQAATFSYEEIHRFLDEAPDFIYLALKVRFIYNKFFSTCILLF